MVGLAELLEQGDLPQHGHGHAVLRQRELHLLDGHDLVADSVPRLVHRPVRAWAVTVLHRHNQTEHFRIMLSRN